MLTRSTSLLLLIALFAAHPASAQRALLAFDEAAKSGLDAEQTSRLTSEEGRQTTAELRLVRVYSDALTEGAGVAVDMPGFDPVVLYGDRLDARSAGNYSWVGTGAHGASGHFVVRPEGVIGTVRTNDGLFRLVPLGKGVHAAVRVNERGFPRDHSPEDEAFTREAMASYSAPSARKASESSVVAPVVNVIVAYTPTAKVEAGGTAAIEALAQLAVDETNTSYANSGVLMRLSLAHVYETTEDDQASFSATLNAFQNTTDGIYDEIHAKRTTFGGDLSVILGREGGSCGVGYIGASSSYAFALSAWDCATGNYSFGHEIGHNIGLRHNTEEDDAGSPFPYGHGLLSAPNGWRTVMSYNNAACPGGFCSRLPRFSTPHVSVSGVPTGDEEIRNSARAIDRRANEVASFRGGSVVSSASLVSNSLAITVNGGQTAAQSFALSNGGAGTLVWDASVRQEDGAAGTSAYAVATSADVGGPAFAFEDIAATGSQLSFALSTACSSSQGGNDNGWAEVPVPFSFEYYGEAVSQVRVSPNGLITTNPTFGACATEPEPLPSPSDPKGVIAPYWTDQLLGLPLAANGVYTESRGSVGSGDARLIVQWDAVYRFGRTSGELNTYQVVIHQDGRVEFQYDTMEGGDNDFTGVGVGIESPDGTGGVMLDMMSGLFVQDAFAVRFTPVAEWLSISGNRYGAVENGSPVSVEFAVDASGLPAGDYEGSVSLMTNDPANPFIELPLTMTVLASAMVQGGPGWRLLSTPAAGVTVDALAGMNLVQGVAGSYPQALPNLFTGYDGANFVASSGTTETLAPGKGFWWYMYDQDIVPGGASNSVELPLLLGTAQAATSSDVSAPIHGGGWNMLGNPFGTGLDVSGVAAWPGASTALSSFVVQTWDASASSYVTSTTTPVMSSWQGFFAEDNGSAASVTIPVSAAVTDGTLSRTNDPAPMLAFKLTAVSGAEQDHAAVLTFLDEASDGRDAYDATKLEPNADTFVTLAFADENSNLRAVESRPLDAVSFSVPVFVQSVGAGADLVLTWPRLEGIPDTWVFELQDLETGDVIDLRSSSAYAFDVVPLEARSGAGGPKTEALQVSSVARFKLSVRTDRVVSNESGHRAELSLGTPRPNPVHNVARMAFELTEAGTVRIRAFDVRGRHVSTLVDGDFVAGEHEAVWNVGGLAAGVYVVRLEAGSDVLTQRIVVSR